MACGKKVPFCFDIEVMLVVTPVQQFLYSAPIWKIYDPSKYWEYPKYYSEIVKDVHQMQRPWKLK